MGQVYGSVGEYLSGIHKALVPPQHCKNHNPPSCHIDCVLKPQPHSAVTSSFSISFSLQEVGSIIGKVIIE